eukprot:4274364-Pyramimonas_sp.AAC.1
MQPVHQLSPCIPNAGACMSRCQRRFCSQRHHVVGSIGTVVVATWRACTEIARDLQPVAPSVAASPTG